MAVVVLDVGAQCALELTATEDHDPVEAFASDRPDEALRERVGRRRLDRRAENLDPFAAEDLIEAVAELRVAIADQEPRRYGSLGHVHARLRACCATHAAFGASLQPARCTRRVPSSIKNST
jgi:hypothetical protein